MELPAATPRPPLRLGLLIDSFVQPSWVAAVIREIQSSSIATVVLVVMNDHVRPSASVSTALHKLWKNRHYYLYALYSKLDGYVTRLHPDAFAPESVESLVVGCPVIRVHPRCGRYTDAFDDSDIELVLGHDLDVALRFGFRILKGGALKIARFGVWSYHHGDPNVNRGGPPGFWEVMHRTPTTGSVLQILSEDLDNGRVIYRSWSATVSRVSVRRNRNNYYWKSVPFVMRAMRDLYAGRLGASVDTAPPEGYQAYSYPIYRRPDNRTMCPLLVSLAARVLGQCLRDVLYFHQWRLAFRRATGPLDANNSFHRFRDMTPPKDRFWADPFPVRIGSTYYIFIEEYLYAARRAHISVIRMLDGGAWEPPVPVLTRPYHLSYPFVFEWEGTHYMIPETSGNRGVELYRCTSFPLEWQFEQQLLPDVRAADVTLHEVDGAWMMFAMIARPGVEENWDELHVFHASRPTGPWAPHERNPVKSDVRSARPAGRLFSVDGVLYRPAQDCSRGYGSAVSINRVLQASRSEFFEEETSRITPNWKAGLEGVHTVNSAGDLTVIDCLVRRRRIL